jgi:uncharacterized protein YbcI
MADVTTISTRSPGWALETITNELIALHKATCGKGPSTARVHAAGNAVVCVMHEGLTRLEQTLVECGHAETVADQRRLLHTTMREAAVALIERVLERRVVSFMPSSDPAAAIESFVFVLE